MGQWYKAGGIGVIAAFGLLAAPTALAAGFDPVAATDAYLAKMSVEARAHSDAYFEGGYWLVLWDFVVLALVAWLLLATGFSAGLRRVLVRVLRRPFLVSLVFGAVYIVVSSLLSLPWNIYEGFYREKQYGLLNQDFIAWSGDQLISLAGAAIGMGVFIAVLYTVIRATPRHWWIWGTGVAILFFAVLQVAAPVFILPLFNTYVPLPAGPVREEILSMARSNGVPATEVYEFDASRQSDRVSANVSGLFGTTRISLNDNLLNKSSPAEIRAVMGHEMGHYVLNHPIKGLIEFGLVLAVGFAFLGWALPWCLARLGAGWGIEGVGDVASLPLLLLLFSFFFFVATPVTNSIIRSQEAEADMFGLNLAHEPDAWAEAALKLAQYRKMSPGPIEEFVFFDHPSGRNRILRAMTWKAENLPAAAESGGQ